MFNLHGPRGISDLTVDKHMALYEKYANGTNEFNEYIFDLVKDGKVDHEGRPAYSQLTRRLGFGKRF